LPTAPRKSPFTAKFPVKILAELCQLAAFHGRAFVFLVECE
jgi:hypothetical protein